jgi:hypothetical protein
MKKNIMVLCCLSFITTFTYAFNQSTLTLTFINHSKETLNYIGMTGPDKKNNTFEVEPATIPPNSTATITGTTNGVSDLYGNLHFTTNTSKIDNIFLIIDKLLINNGQPIFAFTSSQSKITSHVNSTTFNKSGHGRELSYIAATVEVKPKG